MNQGRIIEYIEQGQMMCSLCLQDKGNKLHLLTPLNREMNISPKRAVLISRSSINILNSREQVLNQLKETESLREELKKEIHVKELWELVKDEAIEFDGAYLTELCFGDDINDDHISAVVRAIFEDKLYFKIRDGRFLPNSEERVEQIIQKRADEAILEERLERGSQWLKSALKKPAPERSDPDGEEIQVLKDVALFGNDAPNFKFCKELLSRAGINDMGTARNLLVKLGVWDEDENIEMARLGIRETFDEDLIDQCGHLENRDIDLPVYQDFRDIPIVTVDGPDTQDFDDALSIEERDGEIRLGVHITDVAAFIPPDTVLDKEAFKRGSSIYLPRRQVPMLPHSLCHQTLSLLEGVDRPVLSLIAHFDARGSLLSHQFIPSIIKVKNRLTYNEVNEKYQKDPDLKKMHNLAQILRQRRIEQGALVLSLPEIFLKIENNDPVSIEMLEQGTPSRTMVAEFMILYNHLAARFCKKNRIPILFRSQEEPDERFSIDDSGYTYFVYKQRRHLKPLLITTDPQPHTGLGLDVYTNVSSPIRRFLDLVVQRQMKDFLMGRPFTYDKKSLEQIRMSIEPVVRGYARMKRNRERYWIYKYLARHIDETYSALILYSMKSKYRIVITDFLLLGELKRSNGKDFYDGQVVKVRIKKSDPWNDELKVEYVSH